MATVSAKITGKVREVMIEEGMRVEAGQVMATLDPIDADAQRSLYASQLQAARSQVAGLEAQQKQAAAEASRLQALVGQQLVSRSQYDQAVAQRDSLRAQLERPSATSRSPTTSWPLPIWAWTTTSCARRSPAWSPPRPRSRANRFAAVGGRWFTRTGIGTIVDMDSLEIEVEVGEAFIGRVQPKMPVEATLNAYPEWKIPGEVIAIIPTADRGKATVKVRVALKVKDPRIVPEMGVRVSFLEQAQPQAAAKPQGVRVPAGAVVQREGASVAFVLGDQSRVQQRTVEAGQAMGKDRQILKGVSAGESVVVNPPDTLRDGAKVQQKQAQ